jgi:hypothetical protein
MLPSSGSKYKPSKKSAWKVARSAGFLLCLSLNPEDGGDMFFRNVCLLSADYTALYPTNNHRCENLKSCIECYSLKMVDGARLGYVLMLEATELCGCDETSACEYRREAWPWRQYTYSKFQMKRLWRTCSIFHQQACRLHMLNCDPETEVRCLYEAVPDM